MLVFRMLKIESKFMSDITEKFRALREHAVTEQDLDKLQDLLIEVNRLLDVVQMRVKQLDREKEG
jgi:hypothetical protein